MSKQPFSLEQYLRQSEEKEFTVQITHQDEVSVEITFSGKIHPDNKFNCYIERSAILPKLPTDKMREMFGGLVKGKSKFNAKNLYKDMKK